MELCIKCGNPTAGDVTGSIYCVVCGELQPDVGEFKGIFAGITQLEPQSPSSNDLPS